MAEALRVADSSQRRAESVTATGVPLRVIEGGVQKPTIDRLTDTATRTEANDKKDVSPAEGRLASAFRAAKDTALRWGRQGLIALDGHRVNVATKSLDRLNAEMELARSSGDNGAEAKLAVQIANQLGEIQRLSDRRQVNASEIRKHYEDKLKLPNNNIARGETLLTGEQLPDGARKLGLNDEIGASRKKIDGWIGERDRLRLEFTTLLESSQLDASAKATKAQELAREMKRFADIIEHEQGNLEAKQNVAKSIQGKITANRDAYAKQYAKLDKYSGIASDGRYGTEAANLRNQQEQTRRAAESPALVAPPEAPQPVSKPEAVASQPEATPVSSEKGTELSREDLMNGLREMLGEEIRTILEKIVMSVGGKNMNSMKIKPKDFAGIWNRAKEKVDGLPELSSEHIKKLGDGDMTLAEFGVKIFQNEDVKVSLEMLEKGIKASAEKWVELSRKRLK